MPQDISAIRRMDRDAASMLLVDLRDYCAGVTPDVDFVSADDLVRYIDVVMARFAADYTRAENDAAVLFTPSFSSFPKDAAAIFTAWEGAGGGPSMPALLMVAVERLGLDVTDPAVRAGFIAALLAEVPNDLKYHGNEHYRKVLFHMIRLITAHNALFIGTDDEITPHGIAILLAAACVHDLGHQGGDNLRDGVYTPGYMEQRALDIARPYFDGLGLSSDDRGEIETLVFTTDITFFAGDNSPCVRMRKLYRHHFWGEDIGDPSLLTMGKMRRYEDAPQLVRIAMLLHEADIATSAGVSYEQTRKETMAIIEERDMMTAGPAIVLNFLREQLGQTMNTEAAKQVYGAAMEDIIRSAEDDVERGVKTYYE